MVRVRFSKNAVVIKRGNLFLQLGEKREINDGKRHVAQEGGYPPFVDAARATFPDIAKDGCEILTEPNSVELRHGFGGGGAITSDL